MYEKKLELLGIIARNIEKGYYKGDPIEYIIDVYEIDAILAADIAKLTESVVDEIARFVANSTSLTEQSMEQFLVQKMVGKDTINYILGRRDEPQLTQTFRVKIKHTNPKLLETVNTAFFHHAIAQHSSTYAVDQTSVTFEPNSFIRSMAQSKESFRPKTGCNIIELLGPNNQTLDGSWTSTSLHSLELKDVHQSMLGKPINRFRLWSLGNNAKLQGKFLVICSHTFTTSQQTKNFAFSDGPQTRMFVGPKPTDTHVIDKQSIRADQIIRIPLADRVQIQTPIGLITVKAFKTIPNYERIRNWTDEDVEQMATA